MQVTRVTDDSIAVLHLPLVKQIRLKPTQRDPLVRLSHSDPPFSLVFWKLQPRLTLSILRHAVQTSVWKTHWTVPNQTESSNRFAAFSMHPVKIPTWSVASRLQSPGEKRTSVERKWSRSRRPSSLPYNYCGWRRNWFRFWVHCRPEVWKWRVPCCINDGIKDKESLQT